jgi:RimJ/RimL family protein N-acetyltransferase
MTLEGASQRLPTVLPVLETPRLVLRTPAPADAAMIALLANDLRIAENMARIPHPYRLADAYTFIGSANQVAGEAHFTVSLKDGGLVGGCGIGWPGDVPELGFWLGVAYWGRGYATEAARAVIDYAFTNLGHDRLEAGARVSNPASRRVLEKCGFQWTGVALHRIRALRSSAPIDRFRLDRGIWASLKSWASMRCVA